MFGSFSHSFEPNIAATRHLFPQLRSVLLLGARVLDVGTGRGFLAIEIAREFDSVRVTGVDLWKEKAPWEVHQGFLVNNSLERAEANAEKAGVKARVEFLKADARALPFPPVSFAAVVSGFAIHQMYHYAQRDRRIIDGIYRVLKKGGKFIDADLLAGKEFIKSLRQSGFQNISVKRIGGFTRLVTAEK